MTDHRTLRPCYVLVADRLELDIEVQGSPYACVTEFVFTLRYGREPAGTIRAQVFRLLLASESGWTPRELLQLTNKRLLALYGPLFDPATHRIREEYASTPPFRDLLYIEGLKLAACHRRHGLGRLMVDRVVDVLGEGCAVAVMRAAPLDKYDESKPESLDNDPTLTSDIDDDVYAEPFSKSGEEAKERLRQHFFPLGFRELRGTDFVARNMMGGRWPIAGD